MSKAAAASFADTKSTNPDEVLLVFRYASTFLALAALAVVAHSADPKTATVTFVAEPGSLKNKEYPHSALLIEYSDGKKEWLGFMPGKDGAAGFIDPADQTEWVGSYVRFKLEEAKVVAARKATVDKFKKLKYAVGVTDCVSFTSEFGRNAGLKVTPKPNFSPGNLVANLAKDNADLKPQHDPTVTPKTKLPWR